MWAGHDVLYHSRTSAPVNLKLIGPRDCVERAVAAYGRRGGAAETAWRGSSGR